MEEKRNNKGVIVLLVVIIILLSVLCILFATDTINFNKNKDNNEVNENNSNVVEDNEMNYKDKVIISSSTLDEDTLTKLLGIVGISKDDKIINNCLNIKLSNNNYKENKREIFSWYASMYNINTYRYNEEKCQSSNDCELAYSCGGCSSISKSDAHEILRLFNFDISEIDFLKDLPKYDTDYSYTSSSCCGNACPYYITHNITTKSTSSSEISIVDNQTLSEYDMNNKNIVNTTNQTVTYELKTYDDGSYYLYNVTVDKNQDLIGQYEGNDPWGNSLIVILKSINENTLTWSISNKYYEQELSSNLNDKVATFNVKGNSEKSGMNVDFDYNGVLTLNDESITIKYENGQLTSGGGFMMASALEESAKIIVLKKVK